METIVRQEGFIVSQQTTAPGSLAFYHTREEAEAAAANLVSSNIPVIVVAAIRFTTVKMEQDRR
ncbi:MAG: hypothetical protein JWO38_7455 [Gemmataceae bacterium]|nr:hypothetical protein [Gemmataceae bacterium]